MDLNIYWIKLIVALVLVGSAVSYLFYYSLFLADPHFKLELANDIKVLIIMAFGGALAILGLDHKKIINKIIN